MPSISQRELNTSVIPSVYRRMRSSGSSCTSRLVVTSTASGSAPRIMLRDSSSTGFWPRRATIRMTGSCKYHSASINIDPRGCQSDKHSGARDVFDEEAVQLPEHVEERHATPQVRSRLGEDSVRPQRGTNAVTGNIPPKQAEMLLVRR